MLKKD